MTTTLNSVAPSSPRTESSSTSAILSRGPSSRPSHPGFNRRLGQIAGRFLSALLRAMAAPAA